MSDASIKTILGRLEGISKQVAASDKASAERVGELSLKVYEAVEMLKRKAEAIDGIRAEQKLMGERIDRLEAKGNAA